MNNRKNKIAIVGVWYGNHNPDYFDFWLKSASFNDKIDFYIIGEINGITQLPDNVFYVPMTLSEIEARIQEKINLKVKIKRPYKLCDFRPAYGLIFADILIGYGYWGHCDFDSIWGNLQKILEDYHYSQYDVFLNRGHLTLYRNNESINQLFMKQGDICGGYRSVFQSPINWGFDETQGMNKIIAKNKISSFTENVCADIDFRKERFCHAAETNSLTKNYDYQAFYWENGKVIKVYIDDNHEIATIDYPYIHLQRRKNMVQQDFQFNKRIWITNHGFYNDDSKEITKENIKLANSFHSKEKELAEEEQFSKKHWKLKVRKLLTTTTLGREIIKLYYFLKASN